MKVLCITEESLFRPEAVRWRERMNLLEPLGDALVILPCSMKKPYSSSRSHAKFMKATTDIQEVILTSPFGVCPREMEKTYPIQSYDTSTTGEWSHEEIKVVGECLKDYVGEKEVIAHVEGGYRQVCEEYLDNAVYTSSGQATSTESMNNLKMEVKKHPKLKGRVKTLHLLRSIARYQFNSKKADYWVPDDVKVRGRFDRRLFIDGKQIATLHFSNGLYSLNLEGGKLLQSINKKWIKINFELKTNTLFSPGVSEADPDIIPGDEVVILRDDEVVGVGKSFLSGEEMKRASKGVAVKIRHRKK